jgi:hypothetical protein
MPSIEVTPAIMERLDALAAARGTDVPGVLAEATGLLEVLADAERRGGRILAESASGRMQEISFGGKAA